jgi:hypothetical protein
VQLEQSNEVTLTMRENVEGKCIGCGRAREFGVVEEGEWTQLLDERGERFQAHITPTHQRHHTRKRGGMDLAAAVR